MCENDNILDALRDKKIDFIPKNPYLKRAEKLKCTLYSINEIAKNFFSIFDDNSLPIIIEIGSYMGETLIKLAEANPNVNFIGVDIIFKRVVKTSEKIKKREIPNIKVVIGDGLKLINIIPKKSVSGICIFFPAPWKKKKKKRLINDAFFDRAREILKNKGFLWFKTDDKDYYVNYKSIGIKKGYISKKSFPIILKKINYSTYFESLFENQKKTIYEIFFISGENK